jgi:hypothetical protein
MPASLAERVGAEKEAITANPMGIGFFGAEGEMLAPASFAPQMDCIGNLHDAIYE